MNNNLDTREKLLSIAIELFSASGYKGTSIRDIACVMGMSISTIYHYFGSKEALFTAILDEAGARLINSLQEVAALDMDPLERLELLMRTHLRRCTGTVKEARIFFTDEEHIPSEATKINNQIQRQILDLYRTELQRIQATGRVQYSSMTVLALNILGVINWYLLWFRPGGPLSVDQIIDEIVTFIMHGVLAPSCREKI
jgi:AcrR family transcriptional regulator